jgi:hypothetical protein
LSQAVAEKSGKGTPRRSGKKTPKEERKKKSGKGTPKQRAEKTEQGHPDFKLGQEWVGELDITGNRFESVGSSESLRRIDCNTLHNGRNLRNANMLDGARQLR